MNEDNRIENIVKIYKERFPMGWIDSLVWDKTQNKKSLVNVQEKVAEFKQDVFILFAQSIILGEYIIKDDYATRLESLQELFADAEVHDNEQSKLKTVAINSFNEMTYQLGAVISRFRHVMTMLNDKYGERQTKYIVNAYRIKHKNSWDKSYGRFYDILIEITYTDHFLSYDEETIANLILYHSELSEAVQKKVLQDSSLLLLEILDDKCLFLLKKLLVDDNAEFDYMIDFNHYHYDARDLPFKYFKEMNKLFEFYRSEAYSSNDSLGRDLDVKSRNNTLSIGQFSLLMKYYKDTSNTNKEQINNILKDFDSLYDQKLAQPIKEPFERYALYTLKNYMYNSRFSFLMQDTGYTFGQLQKDLNEIIGIQNQTGVLNFYPFRKAFSKALQLFHTNDAIKKENFQELKDFLQQCIVKFTEAIEWCKTYYFYPIQNQYKECLVKVDGFGDVFIASSFCRPVKYGKLIDDLNTFKNQALLVDNEIALLEEKAELKKIKNDIDHSKTREVEVLSVFTAIITFLFGTIGFFAENKNNDFLHLVFSIFGLGAILLIFVSGIHLVTMRKEEKFWDYFKHPRAWFCLLTIVVCIILLLKFIVIVKALPVA